MFLNSRTSYGLLSKLLHWGMAALLLCVVGLGLYMTAMPVASAEEIENKLWTYSLHKTLGIIALGIALVRCLAAVFQSPPLPLSSWHRLEVVAAVTNHLVLYIGMLLVPLTGWLLHSASEGVTRIWGLPFQQLPFITREPSVAAFFGICHAAAGWLLIAAILVHIFAALKHGILDRDETLQRMLSFRSPGLSSISREKPRTGHSIVLALLIYAAVGGGAGAVFIQAQHAQDRNRAGLENAAPAAWFIDHQSSRLSFEIRLSGTPVSGSFRRWHADIVFDPDDLGGARVLVRVDMDSLALGGIASQALSADFLNAMAHPVAIFKSSSFVQTGPHRYEAHGTLSLAGKTQALTLPFTLTREGGRAIVRMCSSIDRFDYGIGNRSEPEGAMLARDVRVSLLLTAYSCSLKKVCSAGDEKSNNLSGSSIEIIY